MAVISGRFLYDRSHTGDRRRALAVRETITTILFCRPINDM
jgi:hypothetical protein